MNRIRFLSTAALALAAATAAPAPAFAQAEIVSQPNPDAELLAAEIRNLTANPRDLRALLSAAQISTRLDDTSAALAFYARAEAVDPANPRILAGRAAALVRLERPGEAVRLFQQAEARGLSMGDYLPDRAFAYDLLGAPQLAQRDYKAALARKPNDDETVRRYALSLGITGKPDEAMVALDPLLRRSDRAAWRARAFILAMNGDVDGAARISSSMMPGNMGAAMTPFFRRLSTLSVGDRAFAVHFGEMSPTQARRADAQLAPQLPPYVPEPRPAAVAATVVTRPVAPPINTGRDRRSRREREQDELAATTTAALRQVPKVEQRPALPSPPVYEAPRQAIVQAIPTPTPSPVRVASVPVRMPPQPAPDSEADDDAPAPTTIAPTVQHPRPTRVGAEDTALASIVGGITIPASELGIDDPRPKPVTPEPVRVASAEPKPRAEAPKPAPKAETPKPGAKPGAKPAATATDAKGKKKPDTPAPKAKPKPPAEPPRSWVQVGIGQDEDALPRTWAKLVKANPAVFRGKSAWWTPLRATNRLLTGPFKDDDAAQDFVNTLKKAGVSAYAFTSDAGQKVTKLPPK
jgi:tetratricopeptide (TPR) repeat protein